MNYFKLLISIPLFLFLLISCKKDEVSTGPLDFVQVARGDFYGNIHFPTKYSAKIDNLSSFNNLISNMNEFPRYIGDTLNENIDLAEYNLLVIAHPQSHVVTLSMLSVLETEDKLIVTARITNGVGSAFYHPYHIFRIPRIDKPAEFIWEEN